MDCMSASLVTPSACPGHQHHHREQEKSNPQPLKPTRPCCTKREKNPSAAAASGQRDPARYAASSCSPGAGGHRRGCRVALEPTADRPATPPQAARRVGGGSSSRPPGQRRHHSVRLTGYDRVQRRPLLIRIEPLLSLSSPTGYDTKPAWGFVSSRCFIQSKSACVLLFVCFQERAQLEKY